MSDPIHPLAERVYLPVRQSLGETNGKSELHAHDPLVSQAAADYFDDPDRLHGDQVPDVTIKKETPTHRLMIWMHAQGASVADIAKHTGYSTASVRSTLKQPWARQRLLQILKESGLDAVKHFLTHEIAPSLEVLRDIRDGELPNVRPSDRASAANAILDRALGKPTVHVETDNTNRNVPSDVIRLEAEIAETRKRLAERGQLEPHGPGTN